MKLALPFDEALSLATAERPLPALIRSVDCVGETIRAEIDLQALPLRSLGLRLAAAAAGTATVTAAFAGYSDGTARFVVTTHVRSLPVHKLVPYLLEPINRATQASGLPEGLLRIERGDAAPLALVAVQHAVDTRASGVTITHLELRDGVIHAEATIGAIRLRPAQADLEV